MIGVSPGGRVSLLKMLLGRRAREAEIEQLRARARQHHVARLQIAVDDAVAVRAIERVGDLGRVADDLVGRQRPARQPRGQRLALEVLHDQEGDAVLLADVVEHADVRVVQRPDDAGFAVEALAELRVGGELRRQDLDRDLAIEAGVDGAVDLPHASGGDGGNYFVGTQPGAGEPETGSRRGGLYALALQAHTLLYNQRLSVRDLALARM